MKLIFKSGVAMLILSVIFQSAVLAEKKDEECDNNDYVKFTAVNDEKKGGTATLEDGETKIKYYLLYYKDIHLAITKPPDSSKYSFLQSGLSIVFPSLKFGDNIGEAKKTGETTVILIYTDNSDLAEPREQSCETARVIRVDLDVDSDNDGDVKPDDEEEDKIEEDAPGKIFTVDNTDIDYDGIPDFADGFKADENISESESSPFNYITVKINVVIPDDMVKDPKKIKYTFTYQESDPKKAKIIERVPKDEKKKLLGYKCEVPKGFRLWKTNSTTRNKESVLEGGDFIPAVDAKDEPLEIDADKLGLEDGSAEFYFEAVPGAEKTAGQTLKMTVKFEDYAGVEHEHSDIVRITPVNLKIIPDWNRDGVIDDNDKNQVMKRRPWRFWINDDDDADSDSVTGLSEDLLIGGTNDDLPEQSDKDYTDLKVNGMRDLIDFFPLYFDLRYALRDIPRDKYEFVLFQEDSDLKGVTTDYSKSEAKKHLKLSEIDSLKSKELKTVNPDKDASPVLLTDDFLDKIKNEKGIMLFEGAKLSSAPLTLAVKDKSNGKIIVKYEFPLEIVNVKEMYFRKDFRNLITGSGNTDREAKKESYCIKDPNAKTDKNFIYVHGYGVSKSGSYASNSEVFKRLFHTEGFQASFHEVDWQGDPDCGLLTDHYHESIVNAFGTAEVLSDYINKELKGEKYILAHSAGVLLTSTAINDYGLDCGKFFAMDSAVSLEAYGDIKTPAGFVENSGSKLVDKDGNELIKPYNTVVDIENFKLISVEYSNNKCIRKYLYPYRDSIYDSDEYSLPKGKIFLQITSKFIDEEVVCMIKVNGWEKYVLAGQARLLPSEWHSLFGIDDARRKLTWRNRFKKAVSGKVYNFYSSTEDVLHDYDGDMYIKSAWEAIRHGRYLYMFVLQEKCKGRNDSYDLYPGGMFSDLMGYGYNRKAYSKSNIFPPFFRLFTPQEASEISDDKLKKKPFFSLYNPHARFGGGNQKKIRKAIYQLVGSETTAAKLLNSKLSETDLTQYYSDNNKIHDKVSVRDFLLAEAIPTTTLPMGANEIGVPDMQGDSNNFDMSSKDFMTDSTSWPHLDDDDKVEWRHSDFKGVPYQHTKQLYEKFIELMK